MYIQPSSLVTLHYAISFYNDNEVIELANTYNQTPATITIGFGNLPSTIEEYLIGKKEEDNIDIEIENAFGMYNSELKQVVSEDLIFDHSSEQEFEVGDVVSFNTSKGQMAGIFIQKVDNGFLFDFNHPLAGKKIRFIAKIIGVL